MSDENNDNPTAPEGTDVPQSEATTPTEQPQNEEVAPETPKQEAKEQKGPAPIIPPQLAHVAMDMDIKYGGEGGIQKPHVPVTKIYPMNDYVVVETADGKQHPMDYMTALDRADQVKRMLLKENSDKPKDERDKEYWLVYNIVKAAHQCSIYAKKPFSQKSVDKFLYHLDYCMKQIYRNKK